MYQSAGSSMKLSTRIDLALAAIFISLLFASSLYQYRTQQQMVESLVSEQTHTLADSFFDNINTLMLTGQMQKQQIARDKVTQHDNVIDARIVRAPAVANLYGPGQQSGSTPR